MSTRSSALVHRRPGAGALALVLFLATGGGIAEAVDFVRGDCNIDGALDIGDVITTLDALFSGGAPPSCQKACDSNDDGALDIADAIHALAHLFSGGAPPPAPSGGCGSDPTPDALTCAAYGLCPTALSIAAVRALPDGVTDVVLEPVTVTYARPGLPPTLYIQSQPLGPAIILSDPMLPAGIVPTDRITLRVTELSTISGARIITGFADLAVIGSERIAAQVVTNAPDLVADAISYESEYVTADMQVTGAPVASGAGYSQVPVSTSGVVGDPNLFLRFPSAIPFPVGTMVHFTGPLDRVGGEVRFGAYFMVDLLP
jgi:hypothetical protein